MSVTRIASRPDLREPHPAPGRRKHVTLPRGRGPDASAPRPLSASEPGHAYVPALDGVRALAVAAVLAFHGGLAVLPGGFLGVDAFFVLSGYLITSLLLAEWQRSGGIDVVAFWTRRIRRLLPALVVVVGAVALAAPVLVTSGEVLQLRRAAWATLLYANNWQMVLEGDDYFARTAAPDPLEHTWSLAIEEQFYLVWPLLLVLVLQARRPMRSLLGLCLAGAVASAAALMVLHDPFDAGRSYYGTDTRGASLLVGAAAAAALARPERRARLAGSVVVRRLLGVGAGTAAVVVIWAWTHVGGTDPWLYRGGLVVCALAVAVVLAHVAVVPRGLTARLLSLPPLPALGKISYGVYLWPWPIFLGLDAERTGLNGLSLFAVRCAATIAVATVSFVLVERPIREDAFVRRAVITVPGAVIAVALCAALVGVVVRVPAGVPAAAAAGSGGTAEGGLEAFRGALDAPRPQEGRAGAEKGDGREVQRHVHRVRPGRPVVVDVFGDSVAWSMVTALPEHRRLDIRDRTLIGCGVTLRAPYRYFGHVYPRVWRSCRPWVRLWKAAIARDDPDIALIAVGRWETMDRFVEGRWRSLGDPVLDAHLRGRLHAAIRIAGAHGAKVLLATLPYNRRGEQLDGSLFPEDRPERVRAWNALLRDVAARHPGVSVIDLGRRITPESRFTWTAGGYMMRTDGLHLSPDGARAWLAPWLFARLLAAVNARPDPGTAVP